jgi:drug/metabolite transporter (DMT)-like permease
LGHVWLGEAVPPLRSVGIALIVFGVVLVSRTPPRTTEPLPNLAGTRRP